MKSKDLTSYKISQSTGISARLIDYWRSGEKKPGLDNLIKLAQFFNLSIDYLVGLTTPYSNPYHESNMLSRVSEDSVIYHMTNEGNNSRNCISPNEQQLLILYRDSDPTGREKILEQAEFIGRKYKK